MADDGKDRADIIEGELIERDGRTEYRYSSVHAERFDLGRLSLGQRLRLYGRMALLLGLGVLVAGALLFGAFMFAGVFAVLLVVGWVLLKVFGRGPVQRR